MRDLKSMLKTPSLRLRLIALATLIAIISAGPIGMITYHRMTQVTYNLAVDNLGRQTEIISTRMGETFRNMYSDAVIVSHTPPIQGIIRTTHGNGIDPHDGSSMDLWRARLETIFISIMETRPYYTQMRYVGVNDDGRELVRVNAAQSGFQRVPPEGLQRKKNEPYFQEALTLKPDEFYYSEVTFNREHGQIDPSLTPTIRIVIPIYDARSTLFGMIIINADYNQLIQNQILDISPDVSTIISNNTGDYFVFDGLSRTIVTSQYTLNDVYDPHPAITYAIAHNNDTNFLLNDTIYYHIRYDLNPNIQNSYIDIITQIDKEIAIKAAQSIKNESLLSILIITSIVSICAYTLAHYLTAPLLAMSTEMSRYRQAMKTRDPIPASTLNLPIKQKDEIGTLAQTFQILVGELEDSEIKTRAILDSVTDAILVFNYKGNIVRFNPACEILFQASRSQFSQFRIHDLLPNLVNQTTSEDGLSFIQSIYEILGKITESTAQRANKTNFPAEIIINEIIMPQEELFCLTVRDISERKQIDIMKNDFVSTVNHEIRTPLTAIFGSLGLLKLKTRDHLSTDDYRLIEIAYDSCERLSYLVNDILDLERISSGHLEYKMEDINIVTLVKECVQRHTSLGEKNGNRFVIEHDVETVFVHLDPNRFNQALMNLLSNAAKFSPEGERITIRVKLSGLHHVRISVSDHGPGIPKDFRDKVFDRFTQADNSNSRHEGSSGLGLHITKTLIEAFNGSVTFDTVEGRGTTFHFLLPIVQPHES